VKEKEGKITKLKENYWAWKVFTKKAIRKIFTVNLKVIAVYLKENNLKKK